MGDEVDADGDEDDRDNLLPSDDIQPEQDTGGGGHGHGGGGADTKALFKSLDQLRYFKNCETFNVRDHLTAEIYG